MNTFNEIKSLVNEMSNDVEKLLKGNKAAGVRVRKQAQSLKHLSQVLRTEVLSISKSSENS